MDRRSGLWIAAATLFSLANAAGGGYAAGLGEPLHAAAHAGATLLGAIWVWWLVARVWRRERPSLPPVDGQLDRLQQSMDAVALEVERIGEAARFTAKLESEKSEQRR